MVDLVFGLVCRSSVGRLAPFPCSRDFCWNGHSYRSSLLLFVPFHDEVDMLIPSPVEISER